MLCEGPVFGKKIVFKNFSLIFQCLRPVFRPWSGQFWSKSKNKKSILFVSMRPIRNATYVLTKSSMRARHFARRLQVFQNPIFYKNRRPAANKFKLNIPGPLLFLEYLLEKYKNIKKIFFFSTQTTKLSIGTSALGRARRLRVAPGSMAFGHWTRLAAFGCFFYFSCFKLNHNSSIPNINILMDNILLFWCFMYHGADRYIFIFSFL